jgi:hypothetical protein
MVTRFVVLKVPPVYVPPTTSVELAPGVELVKLTVVLKVAPGARLPPDCGNGVPFVAPSFALFITTLLAVTALIFWMLILATTVVEFCLVNVVVTTTLGAPFGVVHT